MSRKLSEIDRTKARKATHVKYNNSINRAVQRLAKKGRMRWEKILIKFAFSGQNPAWSVHNTGKRSFSYHTAPLPPDLDRLVREGTWWIHIELCGSTAFSEAFTMYEGLTEFHNYWFGTTVPLEGDPTRIEETLEGIEVEEIVDRLNGWACRHILDFCKDRWSKIDNAKPNSREQKKALLQSTEVVIERIRHLFRDIAEIEGIISKYVGTTTASRWEALLQGKRMWRYHELMLHRHELRLIYISSHQGIVEGYERKSLGWQSCWRGSNGAMDLIGSFVDRVDQLDDKSDGSSGADSFDEDNYSD